jgi:cell filamentation protein
MKISAINDYPNGALVKDRERLTARYTIYRAIELEDNPIEGNFDAAHLKAVHKHLFQDIKALGFDERPGEFREPVPEGQDWHKRRNLDTVQGSFVVAYSKMDASALVKLDAALNEANPDLMGELPQQEFVKKMAEIYTACDYVHPFYDGNSRALRSFTSQLAQESGYSINWEAFNETPHGRDRLYIARDNDVNKLVFPELENANVRMLVNTSIHALQENKALSQILSDIIEPLPPETKELTHVEKLAAAYEGVDSAEERQEIQLQMQDSPEFTKRFMQQFDEYLETDGYEEHTREELVAVAYFKLTLCDDKGALDRDRTKEFPTDSSVLILNDFHLARKIDEVLKDRTEIAELINIVPANLLVRFNEIIDKTYTEDLSAEREQNQSDDYSL